MNKLIQLKQASINVQWINYHCFSSTKPILIFLHEALGSIPQWRNFPLALCSELNLSGLIIERSGHGNSSELIKPRNEMYLHEYAEETQLVLNECLNPDQPIILVGHSDGGSIGLLLACEAKLNLNGIITMAAHTFVEDITLEGIKIAVDAKKQGKLNGLSKYHFEKTETLFNAWSDTWLNEDFKKWDIREHIKSISIPIYAIQGINDQYGTNKQLDSIACIHPKVVTELIPNCGHHPHLEQEKILVQKISNWIKTIR